MNLNVRIGRVTLLDEGEDLTPILWYTQKDRLHFTSSASYNKNKSGASKDATHSKCQTFVN